MDGSAVDKESTVTLLWASSVFEVKLEVSRKGTVAGGFFKTMGASEVVFETAAVVILVWGITTARVKMVDERVVGGCDLPGARAGAEVAISGLGVTESITGALVVGGNAGFGGAEVIRREATVTVVRSVVMCSGRTGAIFCSEENCEL